MQSVKEELGVYSVPDVRTLSRWRDIWMCTSVVLLVTTGVFLGLFVWSENKESEFSETTLVYTNVVGTKPATLQYSGQQSLQLDECTSPEHVFTMVVPKDSFNPTSVHRTVVSGEMSVALRHNVLQNALDRQYHVMTPGVTLFVDANDLSTSFVDNTGSVDNLMSTTFSAYTAHLYNLTADDSAFTLSLIINEAVSYEPFDRKHAEYKQCDRHFHHDNPSLMQLIGQSTTLQTWALELYRKEQEELRPGDCIFRADRSGWSTVPDLAYRVSQADPNRPQHEHITGDDSAGTPRLLKNDRCFVSSCLTTNPLQFRLFWAGRTRQFRIRLNTESIVSMSGERVFRFSCHSGSGIIRVDFSALHNGLIMSCQSANTASNEQSGDYGERPEWLQTIMNELSGQRPTCFLPRSPPPSPLSPPSPPSPPLPPLVPAPPSPPPPLPPPLPHLPYTTEYIGNCLGGVHRSGVRCDCSYLGDDLDMKLLRCGRPIHYEYAICQDTWVEVSSTDSITTFLCNPTFLYDDGCDCSAVSTPPCTIDRIATTDDNRPTDSCHGTCMAKKCVWQDQMWSQCIRNEVVTPFRSTPDCTQVNLQSCSRSYQNTTVDLRMCAFGLNGFCTTSSYTLQAWCENGIGVDPTF